jgi:hypothetical protein
MDLRTFARDCFLLPQPPRVSALSRSANLLTFVLLVIGVAASLSTKFVFASLPNILLLIIAVLILDVLIQLAPPAKVAQRVQTILYGMLYLVVTCVCGVFAAYAMQRLTFPLQDGLLINLDTAVGFDWIGYAQWVDRHPFVQSLLYPAYHSIALQIALPVFVLGAAHQLEDLRRYLLAFAIAFVATIVISAMMPAAGPIAFVDRASFDILRFTGATPIDHLTRLREAGTLVFDDFPGGIATFPSFHSTVAVLTPLALRKQRWIFVPLLILDAAMLAGTITEGAHYLCDVIAGSAMAFVGYALAKPVLRAETRYELGAATALAIAGSSARAKLSAPIGPTNL